MPGTKGMTPKLQKKMEEIMEELGMMSPRIKSVKKKDGGLMEAIEKVKAKEMQGGGEALNSPKFGSKGGTKTIDINTPSGRRKISEIRKIMPGASRDEIIEFGVNAGVLKKAKGGPIRRRPRPSPMSAMSRLDDAVEEFIETIEPFQGTVRKGETLRNIDGKTMIVRRMPNPNFSDSNRQVVRDMLGDQGRMMSDADRSMMMQMMGARRMEDGGVVPAKFKGFSKLPEDVQQKMNPTLAKKFKAGGPVKMGSGGGVCRGMGAARAGGKFKLR